MKPFNEKDPVTGIEIKSGKTFLHGDVIFERLDEIPSNFENLDRIKDGVIALGEATNHMHKLFRKTDFDSGVGFDLRVTPDGTKFLKVEETIDLKHQEHRAIEIPPGIYKIGIQREYNPWTKLARRVAD